MLDVDNELLEGFNEKAAMVFSVTGGDLSIHGTDRENWAWRAATTDILSKIPPS